MKCLIVLVACVAYVAADCGPLQRIKVKHQWSEAYGSTAEQREHFGTDMWIEIFKAEPKSKELFTRVRGENVYSPEFQAHIVRVLGGLDMSISLLNNEETLNAQLNHLNTQHKTRGIPAEYFDLFEGVLLSTVAHTLDGYDQDAWQSCFRVISHGITV